jgi:hypothetical protein
MKGEPGPVATRAISGCTVPLGVRAGFGNQRWATGAAIYISSPASIHSFRLEMRFVVRLNEFQTYARRPILA